jgi:RNA polymerase sigma-70 factor (ECF subfamily)
MTDATDCQLLERFVAHRDEAAFAVLARRHAARVRGVCRRVLRDPHDAEDVLQATFLVLARRAVVLPWQPSVGPWLSAVAHRLAVNARAARQRCREHPLGDVNDPEPPAPDSDPAAAMARQEVSGLVRREVARLPEKYRAPVVLCYLEGLSNEQAARALGWPTGSMSRRLEKARQMLRQRLSGLALLSFALLLALAPLWLAGNRSRPSGESVCKADPGTRFDPAVEELLRRLAGERPPEISREQLVALADGAARSADRLKDRDPGRRRDDWRRFAEETIAAARQLASAAETDDRPATLLAAGRLHMACSRCHETFRD